MGKDIVTRLNVSLQGIFWGFYRSDNFFNRRDLLKLNVYKSNYNNFEELNNEIIEANPDNGYEYEEIDSINSSDDNVRLTLYLEKHNRNSPKWHTEVGKLFEYELENDNGYILNSLIVAETNKNNYILSFGNAHHKAVSICDVEFGLDFAERVMKSQSVEVKSVSYALSNKRKEITNFKENQTELPQANESYSNISGKPKWENIYGNSIECSLSVKIFKDINIEKDNAETSIFSIFNEIDETLSRKPDTSIPRFKKIRKNNDLHDSLFRILFNRLKGDNSDKLIDFGFNKIINDGTSMNLLDNNIEVKSYVNNNSGNSKSIKLDDGSLKQLVSEYSKKYNLFDINCIKFKIEDTNSGKSMIKTIGEVIHCEMEVNEQIYVLDDGYWNFYNNAFLELLDENLDYINSIVHKKTEFQIDYSNDEKLKGEDAYINKLQTHDDFTQLHKKFFNVNSIKVELADLFSANNNELFAIKRGMETKDITHSFNQASLAMNALNNKREFKIQKFLEDTIENTSIQNQIMKCENYSILWLIKGKPQYMWEMVKNNEIDLKSIKSIFIKLAIYDWYQKSKENDFNPKIYFALDSPDKGNKES